MTLHAIKLCLSLLIAMGGLITVEHFKLGRISRL